MTINLTARRPNTSKRRLQFDTSGIAVILTTEDKRQDYETLAAGTRIVESWYVRHGPG